MSIEQNRKLAEQLFAHLSAGEIPAAIGMMTDDLSWTVSGRREIYPGAGVYDKRRVEKLFKSIVSQTKNGLGMTIKNSIAEGDKISLEIESLGHLNNGRVYEQRFHFFLEFREGKIGTVREYLDTQYAFNTWYVKDPLEYDPSAAENLADPFPLFRKLAKERPVSWSAALNGWVLVKYEHVLKALANPLLSNARVQPLIARLPEEMRPAYQRFGLMFAHSLNFNDAPAHTRIKNSIKEVFSKDYVARLNSSIAASADALLAPHLERGTIDVVNDLAGPLGVKVLAEFIGVPAEEFLRLKHLSEEVLLFAGRSSARVTNKLERARVALEEMADYFEMAFARKRAAPGEDAISAFVRAEDRGDVTHDEMLAQAHNLVMAGAENIRFMGGNAALALLNHPSELARWRDEPASRANGLEELLRFDGPDQGLARLVTADVEIGGQQIRAGQVVYCLLNAANRDETRFPEPDRLDLTRSDTRHMGMGAGIHKCIGQHLARIEINHLLTALVTKTKDLAVAPGALRYIDSLTFRGLESLPLTFSRQ